MIKKNEFKVSIPTKFVQKNILDEYELMVYTYLKFKIQKFGELNCVVSADEIGLSFWGEDMIVTKRNKIREAIESLFDKNILVGEYRNKYYIIDPECLAGTSEERFFIVTFDEFVTIVRNKDTKYSLELFFYFCLMISSFNGKNSCEMNGVTYRGFCGTLSKGFFLDRLAAKETTLTKWDNILMKYGLIYKTAKITDNKTQVCYGRYNDAAKIRKFMGVNSSYNYSTINKKRSLTQKYHRLCNGADYTMPEIMEIYQHCVGYNEKCDKAYMETGDKLALSKKFDLKVFADFIRLEEQN